MADDLKVTVKILRGRDVIAAGLLKLHPEAFVRTDSREFGESDEDAALRHIFTVERAINATGELRAHIDVAPTC